MAMKILVVCHFFPMPDRQADTVRLCHLLKILSMKARVSFLPAKRCGRPANMARQSSENTGKPSKRLA